MNVLFVLWDRISTQFLLGGKRKCLSLLVDLFSDINFFWRAMKIAVRVEGYDEPFAGDYSDAAGLCAGVSQHCGVPVNGLECYDAQAGDFFPLVESDLRSRMRVRIKETRVVIRRDLRDDPKVDAEVAAKFIDLRSQRSCNIYVVATNTGYRSVCLDCDPARLMSSDLSNAKTHLTSLKHSRARPLGGLYSLLSTAAGQDEDAWKQYMRDMAAPDAGVKRPLEDGAPAPAADPKLLAYNSLLHDNSCLTDDVTADTVTCSYCNKIMNRSYCINHDCRTLKVHLGSKDHTDKVKQRAAAKKMDITGYLQRGPPAQKQLKPTVNL